MSGKPIVPGLIRRGNRFSVRIQVPKDLQAEVGKKEFWKKLGTEDRYDATSRALDIIRDERAKFDRVRRRLRGAHRIVDELADHELPSLGREVYASYLNAVDECADTGKLVHGEDWDTHVRSNEAWLSEMERSHAKNGADNETAQELADEILEDNLIRVDKTSQNYQRLCKLAMDAPLELQRRVVARLHGREIREPPDPRFVDVAGQVQNFTPVRDQNVDVPRSYTLLSLIHRSMERSHRSRTGKTRKSLRGYLENTAAILGPGKDIRTVTHADCLTAREIIEKRPTNFKKLKPFEKLPLKQVAEIATCEGMQTLSPQRINNYVDAFYPFRRRCEGSQLINSVPVRRELLRVADPEKRDNKRLPFSADQLQSIFSSGA